LNTSNVFLDIGKLAFGRITPSETELFALNSPRALGPGAIAAFSPDTGDIIRRYRVPYPARLYPATLPAWEASADQVSLLSRGEVLDSLTYSASWHHPLIRDPEGVSLERIAPGSPGVVAQRGRHQRLGDAHGSQFTHPAPRVGYGQALYRYRSRLQPEQ